MLRDRRPDIRLRQAQARKFARGDADDGGRLVVEEDDPADRRRIAAEVAPPESVTQNHYRFGMDRSIESGLQQPAQRGRGTQFLEPILRYEVRLQRPFFSVHRQVGIVQRQHGRERLAVLAEESYFRVWQNERVGLRRTSMKAQERGRIANVERPQYHEVEEAECGDVDTGAEGEHEHRHDGEAGRFS